MEGGFSLKEALPLLIVNINIVIICVLDKAVCDFDAKFLLGLIIYEYCLISSGKMDTNTFKVRSHL